MRVPILLVLSVVACKADDLDSAVESDTDTDTDSDTDTDTDTDTDSDTDSDTDADTDSDTDTDPALICALPDAFDVGLTPTGTIHVDENGSDATGDGSIAAPYRTIERAAQDAAPGDQILLAPGTYEADQYVAGLTGTATDPIWIGGTPGQPKPVLSGGAQGMHLVQANYVAVHDLEISGATANGLNADDGSAYADPLAAHHIVFRDLYIHDVGTGGNQDCLKLSGLNDYHVLDSLFERCGDGGSGVDHVGCHHGVIAGNTFRDLGSSGVQNKGGSDDIEIRANLFEDSGLRPVNMGGSTGFDFFRPPLDPAGENFEARDIRVVANVFVGGHSPMAFVGCVDCVATHNTIVNPENWVFRILQETPSTGTGFAFAQSRGGIVRNNLVILERSDVSVDVNIGADTDSASFVFENNLWYASDTPAASSPTLPGTVTGTVTADPLLEPDFRPGTGSAALGAGIPGADMGGDFEDACWASPPNIGAFATP